MCILNILQWTYTFTLSMWIYCKHLIFIISKIKLTSSIFKPVSFSTAISTNCSTKIWAPNSALSPQAVPSGPDPSISICQRSANMQLQPDSDRQSRPVLIGLSVWATPGRGPKLSHLYVLSCWHTGGTWKMFDEIKSPSGAGQGPEGWPIGWKEHPRANSKVS